MYQVQKGDTIAKVTRLLNTSWENLRRLNPKAIGQSQKTGRWFLKEGAIIKTELTFESMLHEAQKTDRISLPATQAIPNLSQPRAPIDIAVRQVHAVGNTPIPAKSAGGERCAVPTTNPADNRPALAVEHSHVRLEDIVRECGLETPPRIRQGMKVRYRPPFFTRPQPVIASWYGDSHQGKTMANGKPYDMNAPTIAHKDLPLGTKVELHNIETGEQAMAVVTDRGPYIKGREVDLSYEVARRLSLVEKGVGRLFMRILE